MKYARIIDSQGNLLKNGQGGIIKIPATQFGTKKDAQAYLETLQQKTGKNDLRFCCSYGACCASVHFRKASDMTTGTRARARTAAWVSDNVKDHLPNCPGPDDIDINHLPHNGLTIQDAALKQNETILIHLNIELGVRAKAAFDRKNHRQTADVKFRTDNPNSHSYFSVSSLAKLSDIIATVAKNAGKDGLERIKIAHEGSLPPLSKFIVRNNAKDRMKILDGYGDDRGLYNKALFRKKYPQHSDYVFGPPRLLIFEAPQAYRQILKRDENPLRANGWRYDVGDGRVVYDQLNLRNVGVQAPQLFPNGALVIAKPFIHKDANPDYPIIHWSIQGPDNIQQSPPAEVIKALCWYGQHIPNGQPPIQPKLI